MPMIAAVVASIEAIRAFDTADPTQDPRSRGLAAQAEGHVLAARVRADVGRRMRGQPSAVLKMANAAALRAALLRFYLVMQAETEAATRHMILEIEQRLLLHQAIVLLDDIRPRSGASTSVWDQRPELIAAAREQFMTASSGMFLELITIREARRLLERRYLGGHPFLHPERVKEEDRLLATALELVGIAAFIAQEGEFARQSGEPAASTPELDVDVLQARAETDAPAVAAAFADRTRVAVLLSIGDLEKAIAIEEYARWRG
jgi:hypothetical protein